MSFVTLMFILTGAMLIASSIENRSIVAYAQGWLGKA